MRRPALAFLLLLAVMRAQDVPPPPKPADNGPSLQDTMKFIQDKINSLGKVSFIEFRHDTNTGQDFTNRFDYEISNVSANTQQCRISEHWKVSVNGAVAQDMDASFSLRNVHDVTAEPMERNQIRIDAKAGHPEYITNSTSPPIIVLIANRTDGGVNTFPFVDSALADRVAKAITHAVELCAGGGKEPF